MAREAMAFFRTFMLVFAVVALLVGAFMIFNTFSITVAQRTRENGLLRALGAGRRQMLRLGAARGARRRGHRVAARPRRRPGRWPSGSRRCSLPSASRSPARASCSRPARSVISLAVGIGVTLLAALSPARKAAKVPPIAAMQQGAVGSTGYGSRQRIFVGCGLLALGLGALLTGLFGSVGQAFAAGRRRCAARVLRGVGARPHHRAAAEPRDRLAVAAAAWRHRRARAGERDAQPQAHGGQRLGADDRRRPGRRSSRSSSRRPRPRMDAGHRPVVHRGHRGRPPAAACMGGVDPSLAQRARRAARGRHATGLRQGFASVDGNVTSVTGVDTATAFDVIDDRADRGLAGRPEPERRSAVSEDTATAKHLRRRRRGARGVQGHRPAAAAGRDDLRRGPAWSAPTCSGMPAYDANFSTHFDSRSSSSRRRTSRRRPALAAVTRAATPYAGVTVLDRAGFKAEQTQPLNQMLALVYALLGLAILIALLGIAQHAGPVDLRADPGDRAAAGGRHDPAPAAVGDPLGVGDHRPAGHRARPADRPVLRLGAGAGAGGRGARRCSASRSAAWPSSSCSPPWPAWSPPSGRAAGPPSSTCCARW